jgi:hypothetical protein
MDEKLEELRGRGAERLGGERVACLGLGIWEIWDGGIWAGDLSWEVDGRTDVTFHSFVGLLIHSFIQSFVHPLPLTLHVNPPPHLPNPTGVRLCGFEDTGGELGCRKVDRQIEMTLAPFVRSSRSIPLILDYSTSLRRVCVDPGTLWGI